MVEKNVNLCALPGKAACLGVGMHENTQGGGEPGPQTYVLFILEFWAGSETVNQRELALRGSGPSSRTG